MTELDESKDFFPKKVQLVCRNAPRGGEKDRTAFGLSEAGRAAPASAQLHDIGLCCARCCAMAPCHRFRERAVKDVEVSAGVA